MSTPFAPGPEESNALSSRERAILAELERDLRDDEPGHDEPDDADPTGAPVRPGPEADGPVVAARSPISLARLVLLVPALVLIIVSAALLPASWSVVLAPLTLFAVVPWIVWCVTGRRRSR